MPQRAGRVIQLRRSYPRFASGILTRHARRGTI